MKLLDIKGKRYGYLNVLERGPDKISPSGQRHVRWLCKCDCGNTALVSGMSLRNGHTTSCGCHRSEVSYELADMRRKKNVYEFHDDYVIGYAGDTPFIFDREDFSKVSALFWRITSKGYVKAKNHGSEVFIHRFILNPPDEMQIDHINHDKRDNRKCNLRIVSNSENVQNIGMLKNNTSGCKGVAFNKRQKKWVSYIGVNAGRIHLGYFDRFEDAVNARQCAENRFYGENSFSNCQRIAASNAIISAGK